MHSICWIRRCNICILYVGLEGAIYAFYMLDSKVQYMHSICWIRGCNICILYVGLRVHCYVIRQ